MTQSATGDVQKQHRDSVWGPVVAATRTPRVILAVGLSLLAFWWLGGVIHFPYDGPFDASLFHQPLATAKLLIVALALWVVTVLGTLLAGRVRYDAGWGAAVFGLLALRWRGGDVYYTLNGRSAGVFLGLAVELLVLAVVASAAWALLHWLRERGTRAPGIKRILELPDPRNRMVDRKQASDGWDQRALALLCSVAVTATIVMVLARTQDETQVFFAVLIGGWAGAAVSHAIVPTRPGPWFWAGPIVAGLIGYLAAWWSTPEWRLATGEVGGALAQLARPLPLDWIGAGVPAALFGYVRARTKQLRRVAEAQAQT